MTIRTIATGSIPIARVESDEVVVHNVDTALDLMADVRYQTGADTIIIDSDCLHGDFFDLSTNLAGEILQKFTNYRMKIAIVGDFSHYGSKSLRDFIRESNKGGQVPGRTHEIGN